MINNRFEDNRAVKVVLFLLAHILLGILIQIGAAYVLEGVMTFGEGLSAKHEEYSEIVDSLTAPNPGMLVYVSIVAPLIEEAVFRLGLIGLGQKFLKFWIVNIISSVLFGFYHGNIVQGVYAFLLGLVLGMLFKYSKGYMASSLVHISINIGGIYIAPLLVSMNTPVQNLLVGFAALAVGALVLYNIIKSNMKNDNKKTVPASS